MPVYQLPNGKVVNLSIEDLLNMTDEDEQFLIASNSGEYPGSTLYGSAITKGERQAKKDYYDTDGLDIETDSDEVCPDQPIDLDSLPDEDSSANT